MERRIAVLLVGLLIAGCGMLATAVAACIMVLQESPPAPVSTAPPLASR